MSLDYINPMTHLYKEFLIILQKIVIKYKYKADVYETIDMTRNADQYIDALQKKDTFFTYIDYTEDEFKQAGIYDMKLIKEFYDDSNVIPVDNYDFVSHYNQYVNEQKKLGVKSIISFNKFKEIIESDTDENIKANRKYGTCYRAKLLNIRRKKIIDDYVEKNNYYRMLNGQPDIETDPKYFYYVSDIIAKQYPEYPKLDQIPLHLIQDYYNELDTENHTQGDQVISMLEGIGYIETVKNASRENRHLIYGGTFDGLSVRLTSEGKKELGYDESVNPVLQLTNDTSVRTGYKMSKNIYFISTNISKFAGIDINIGDWLLTDGAKWKKIDNTTNIDGETTACEPYLNYLGTHRISILKARKTKNFDILYLDKNLIRSNVYNTFVELYGQCRDYIATVVYQHEFTSFINFYDNFIAMCIMLMTELQLINKQIPFEVRRNFFDIYALRMLYEAYNIPYNVYVDEDTQNLIAQNLNLLILHKATNKVIYDVANLLGFSNMTAYKYYLAKQHKFDPYGVPIFKTKQVFNNDSGEFEIVPDYKEMYDIYFQKEELMEDDFIQAFNSKVNRVEYDAITTNDPFWWEDQNLTDRKNMTDYNFIEAKYLSLGLSYKMSDMLFENIILLKMLIYNEKELSDIMISLPRILPGAMVPIFDTVILLLCLLSKAHKLKGEIISTPSSIISVLDYLNNLDSDKGLVDTFAFDFEYFREKFKKESVWADDGIGYYSFNNSSNEYIYYNNKGHKAIKPVKQEYVEDLISKGLVTQETRYSDKEVYKIFNYLSEKEMERFESFIDTLATPLSNYNGRADKIEALNNMYWSIDSNGDYTGVRGLYQFLNKLMRDADNFENYTALKTLYNTIFYSREIRDVFTINIYSSDGSMHSRTAKNFFEYLYHRNRTLYLSIFSIDFEEEYHKFLNNNRFPLYIRSTSQSDNSYLVVDDGEENHQTKVSISEVSTVISNIMVGDYVELLDEPSYLTFMEKVNEGKIEIDYSTMKETSNSSTANDVISSLIYTYVNHIIAQYKKILTNIKYQQMLNSVSTLLESLLIEMIKFIKSFTVDLISLDTILICDFKPENLLRFIDKVHYIDKTIVAPDTMNFGFWDSVKIGSTYQCNDAMKFKDIITSTWFSDPNNSLNIPSNRGIFAIYDVNGSISGYNESSSNLINNMPNYHCIETSNDIIDYPVSNTNIKLHICGPKLVKNNDTYSIIYDDSYLNNPELYPGIFLSFNGTDLETTTDHNIIPDSYEYTVYMVCKSIDVDDVVGIMHGNGPSVRFLSTPLIDIYSVIGTTSISIREYNIDASTFDLKFENHIITKSLTHDWHIIAMTQKQNTVKVYIDGRRVLDRTFKKRTFDNGHTDPFNVKIMPNQMIGQNFKDVYKQSYSYYKCGFDFKMFGFANVAHNGAELQENSKWFANKYNIDID